jgi:hypothetical protein
LTEGDTGPPGDIELVLTSGTVYPVHVGEGLEHDAAPKLAAVDYLSHLDDGSIQALSVANDHPDAGAVHGADDSVALLQVEGHGLVRHDVLAVRGGHERVLGVQVGGGTDVDDVHVGALAQVLGVQVGLPAELAGEPVAGGLARVGRGDDVHEGLHRQLRHQVHSGHAEPGDANAQLPGLCHGGPLWAMVLHGPDGLPRSNSG